MYEIPCECEIPLECGAYAEWGYDDDDCEGHCACEREGDSERGTGMGLELPEPVGTPSTPGRSCVRPPPPTGYSCILGPAPRLGTELEIRGVGIATPTGGGSVPPDRKLGQSERSSGSEVPVPPAEEGARCERIAAASRSWTCWCLLSTNLEASRHCGACSQRCLMRQDGWR